MLNPEFLTADRVRVDVEASSRKDALQSLSLLLASGPGSLTAPEIFELLDQRERLGSTCLGNGVAVPHGRDPGLDEPVGALLRFTSPVDFDAGEDAEISVAVGLMLPEDEGGELSTVVAALRTESSPQALQDAATPDAAVTAMRAFLPGPGTDDGSA
ncbi:MAG: PTS sugar transporter subunit IIA [Chromatiales bacterium]|nr:MAG: PTS sugar transporter subunit IIA [Chromatiales bacterium]